MRKDEVIKQICDELVDECIIEGYTYDHFNQDEVVPLPYAVYRRIAPQSFSADDMTYHHDTNVDFEIYADDPEIMANIMEVVESKLEEAEVYYEITADTVYIDSEDFYESLYEL